MNKMENLQLITKLYDKSIYYEGGEPSGLLCLAGDRIGELVQELQVIKKTYKNIIDEKCAGDEQHCTCVPALREKIKELEKLYYDLADCIAKESYSPEHLKFLVRRQRKELQALKANKPSEEEIEEIVWKFHNYLCTTKLDIAKEWVADIAKAIYKRITQ